MTRRGLSATPAITSDRKILIRENGRSAFLFLPFSPPLSPSLCPICPSFRGGPPYTFIYLGMSKCKALLGAWNDMRRPYFSHFSIKTRFATYPSCLLWDITFYLNIYALPCTAHGLRVLCEELSPRDIVYTRCASMRV